ncbi:MAG: ABC transporter permease [Anaerolineales bacterium]
MKFLLDNPILSKELRGRMRGWKGSALLVAYLMLLGFFVLSFYAAFAVEANSSSNPGDTQTMGKIIFGTVVVSELLMVSFIAPALTSGAFASERERQTFDLLKISLLSDVDLVLGKLSAALGYLLLLIFAALPLEAIAFILGGVGLAEFIVSTLMLFVTALFFCALGLLTSSFSKRVIVSTVMSYAFNILSALVFFIGIFLTAIFESLSVSASQPNPLAEKFFSSLLWFLFSTNSLFAAFASESFLISEQNLWLVSGGGLFGSTNVTMLSPWIIYVVMYALGSLLLLTLSVHFIRHVE